MLSIPSAHPRGGHVGLWQALRSTGWRRTGAFNVLGAFASGIVLLCCLLTSVSQPESSLQSDTVLFRGSCETSRNLNIALHLVLNLVSSGVLASSNYFMQILNAPSRHEIDLAHHTLSSVEIGIPSLKNLPFLSRFKQCMWALLLITSLPIHLFFNSAIYETSYEGSTWNLTIATEQFLQGAPFFPPGASLAPAGRPSPIYDLIEHKFNQSAGLHEELTYYHWKMYWYSSYGKFTEFSEYWNESSPIRQALSQTASSIRQKGRDRHWVRLSSKQCRQEYCSCRPRKEYEDVVVVVDPGPNRGGWTRAEVYADPQGDLPGLTMSDLDDHLPRDEVNSLWYHTQCENHKSAVYSLEESLCEDKGPVCSGALGYFWDRVSLPFIDYEKKMATSPEEDWSIMFKNWTGPAKSREEKLGYDNSFSTLSVEYCLAHRGPKDKCKVNMANTLILATMLCIFCKVFICSLVVGLLPAESLVTPGDAINSFLCEPDPATLGVGTGDVDDFHRLEYAIPCPLFQASEEYALVSSVPRARAWQQKRRRIISAMPRSAWWRAYTPIVTSLGTLTYFTAMTNIQVKGSSKGSFGHDGSTLLVNMDFGRSSLNKLMLANLGQLVLSWCYFAYNSLLTRIHVEKELNSHGMSFKPLRVSFPEGEQSVTWRLQLPYKFGIPLLLIGILLHWLASNSIFVLIMEGGFWLSEDDGLDTRNNRGLEPGSVVAVSYSPLAILITLAVSSALVTVPFFISLYRLPGDMVAGGCNSLVLSAACHAFCSASDADETTPKYGQGSGPLSPGGSSDSDGEQPPEREMPISRMDGDDNVRNALVTLAQSKLRWGVVPLTPELRDMARETGQEAALHLSFATEETFISPPVDGERYM